MSVIEFQTRSSGMFICGLFKDSSNTLDDQLSVNIKTMYREAATAYLRYQEYAFRDRKNREPQPDKPVLGSRPVAGKTEYEAGVLHT
jgi:hypothetical protein